MFLEVIFITSCILAQLGAKTQPIDKIRTPINFSERQLISEYIESVKDKCNITFSVDIRSICSRPIEVATEQIPSYFDYQHAVCMTLYDSIQRICSQKNEEKLQLDHSEQRVKNISSTCNKMRAALNVSMSTKNEFGMGWVRALNEKLKDDDNCIRTCIDNGIVNPVCSAVMLANAYLKKIQSINTTEKLPVVNVPARKPAPSENKAGENGADIPKSSSASYPENPPLDLDAMMQTMEERNPNEQGGNNFYDQSPEDVNFAIPTIPEELRREETEKANQDSPVVAETPSSIPKSVNSIEKIKNADAHTKSKTHEENIQPEIRKGKVDPESQKGNVKAKSPDETPQAPIEKVPVHQNVNEQSEKDTVAQAKPVVESSQKAPPKGNSNDENVHITVESSRPENIKSESMKPENPKPGNVEKSVNDSPQKTTDSKQDKTTATQNLESKVIGTDANNPNDNLSNEDEDINVHGDADLGDVEIDNGISSDNELGDTPSETQLKKDENLNSLDGDDDIDLNTAAEKVPYSRDKFVNAEDSHFFAYFMTMVLLCIVGYLVFHNKQKILALALEGRSRRSTRRRPNTSGYRKLDSNLEEAVTSTCSTSVTHVIY